MLRKFESGDKIAALKGLDIAIISILLLLIVCDSLIDTIGISYFYIELIRSIINIFKVILLKRIETLLPKRQEHTEKDISSKNFDTTNLIKNAFNGNGTIIQVYQVYVNNYYEGVRKLNFLIKIG